MHNYILSKTLAEITNYQKLLENAQWMACEGLYEASLRNLNQNLRPSSDLKMLSQ